MSIDLMDLRMCLCVCVWCAGQSKLKPEVGIHLCNAMYELAQQSK